MKKTNGGVIGANVVPTGVQPDASASGVWNLKDVESHEKAGDWPQPNTPPDASGINYTDGLIASPAQLSVPKGQTLTVSFANAADLEDSNLTYEVIIETEGSTTSQTYNAVQGMPWLTDADRTIFDPVTNTFSPDPVNGAWHNFAPYSSSAEGKLPSYWIWMKTDELGETLPQPHLYENSEDWQYIGSTRMVNGAPKSWSTRACYVYDANGINGVLQDGTNGTADVIMKSQCDAVGGVFHTSYPFFTGINSMYGPTGWPSTKWGVDALGQGAALTWSVIPSNTSFSSLGYDPASGDSYTEDWSTLPFHDYTADFRIVFAEIEQVCNLTFTEVSFDANNSTHADIIIGFAPLEDRISTVLAYAHFPEGDATEADPEYIKHQSGNIMIDSNGTSWWSPSQSSGNINTSHNYRHVFRHELLHSIGIMHNPDLDSVMYPSVSSGGAEKFLYDGEKAGLEYLYGPSTVSNTAPIAYNVKLFTNKDISLTIDFLSCATDLDGDALSLSTASVVNGSLSNGIYTPPAGFTGDDTITFTVTDGTLTSNTGEIIVTVSESSSGAGTYTNVGVTVPRNGCWMMKDMADTTQNNYVWEKSTGNMYRQASGPDTESTNINLNELDYYTSWAGWVTYESGMNLYKVINSFPDNITHSYYNATQADFTKD